MVAVCWVQSADRQREHCQVRPRRESIPEPATRRSGQDFPRPDGAFWAPPALEASWGVLVEELINSHIYLPFHRADNLEKGFLMTALLPATPAGGMGEIGTQSTSAWCLSFPRVSSPSVEVFKQN